MVTACGPGVAVYSLIGQPSDLLSQLALNFSSHAQRAM